MSRHETIDAEHHQNIVFRVNDFLSRSGLSDSELARRAGVPQTFVWHVRRGGFVKSTPRLRRLLQYIHMELALPDEAVDEVMRAAKGFLAVGGDLKVLASGIELMTKAYAGGPE